MSIGLSCEKLFLSLASETKYDKQGLKLTLSASPGDDRTLAWYDWLGFLGWYKMFN